MTSSKVQRAAALAIEDLGHIGRRQEAHVNCRGAPLHTAPYTLKLGGIKRTNENHADDHKSVLEAVLPPNIACFQATFCIALLQIRNLCFMIMP